MKKSQYLKKFLISSLALVMVVTSLTQMAIHANAENNFDINGEKVYINSLDDLIEVAKASRGIGKYADNPMEFEGRYLYLESDIKITEDDVKNISESDLQVLTIGGIGNESLPFMGIFDGQGHTITGLDNQKGVLPDHNISLFGEIEDATIKNLTLDHANVDAAYEAGILVGEARNSEISNVVVMNSKLKVQPANNVVSLITNLGTNGGAIAGKIENTILYNCESVNTTVYNNTTSGITGVGGERLDLGGLVGYSINSTIEYSRVRGGRVRNKYDIAIGALGGKELMTGGIVGEMNNTKVIDCFSTTDLISDGKNIVAVGSGVAGYTGGIAGVIYDDGNEIIRSHFAGTMDSYQYNAIAVIPIIQKDVNLAGLVGTDALDSSLKVENSFYRQDTLNTDDNSKVKLLGFDCSDVTNSKGLSNSEYENKSLWKNADYDFFAEEERDTAYNGSHCNQWVMDYELKMPIHGHSLSATFDFPDAAEVFIEKTYTDWYLKDDEDETADSKEETSTHSTDNPYQFAVMGYDTNQDKMTLKAETKTISDIEEAYKFVGWYKRQDKYQGDSIPELPSFFKDIVSEQNEKVSAGSTYQLKLKDDNVDDNNDLYVAHYQARVLFYDKDGIKINDAYYNYQDELPEFNLTIPEGCTFYGWTTIANTDSDSNGAYIGITSNQLSNIKSQNELYQTGDPIEKPMKLYPIFTDYSSNAIVEVEGYNVEDPGNDNKAIRPDVAQASVISTNDGKIQLNLSPLDDKNLENGEEGYRFLGWYEIDSEDSTQVGHRISKEMTYTLPDDIDLTEEHYYIAKFEYRVNYWVQLNETDGELNKKTLYATLWEKFGNPFENIDGPETHYKHISHWDIKRDNIEIPVIHDTSSEDTDKYTGKINKPLDVWGHINKKTNNIGFHSAYVVSDFPRSADITVEWKSPWVATERKGNLKLEEGYSDKGYNFKFWTAEEKSKRITPKISNSEPVWEGAFYADLKLDLTFIGVAHMTANVVFNGIPSSNKKTVERRYEEAVFLEINNDNENYYKYVAKANQNNNEDIMEYINSNNINITSLASPSNAEMEKDGYLFLGWVDKNSITDEEFNYIYGGGVDDSTYATDDARKAIPYLLDDSAVVTKPMDLYPVYVTTNFTTTTNIKESGITVNHLNINLPIDPTYSKDSISTTNGYADITFTVDNNETHVLKNDTGTMYQFKYLEYVDATGKTIRLNLENSGEKTVKVSNILLGPSYKFIAYYEPYVLTYHVSDNESQFEVRNSGDKVGQQPDAVFENIDNYIFTGWTNEKPSSGNYYTSNEDLTLIDSDDFVTGSMELWAVYNTAKIKVTSNIDEELNVSGSDLTNIRGWRKTDSGGYELFAQETVSINDQNYVFVGWKNFVNDQEYITKSTNYSVNPLEGKNYIAIYEQSVTVTYHFLNGESREVQVVANERSFVEKISDGDNETVSMIDAEIMQEMLNTLEKNDLFIQWQWNDNGVMVDWNKFFDKKINSKMDLYPVVYHLNGKDSEDNPINDDMTFIYDKNDSGIPVSINAYLNVPYTQNKLTVILEKSCFNNGVIQKNPVPKMPVKLWVANENMQVPDEGNNGDDDVKDPYIKYETKQTDESGNAVFEFNGQLILTKKIENQSNSNDVFIFKIEKLSLDGQSTQQIEIPLKMSGKETNTITLTLPCGKYKVIEDESWAWRYSVTPELGSVDEKGYISIIPYYKNNPRTITFTNTKENSKWFNNTDCEHNVYGQNQGGNQ